MKTRKLVRSVLATGACLLAGASLTLVNAAEIEEIIVTATKRAENLQDVPIAVSAFTSGTINEERIDDLQEIAIRTPSFTIGQNGPSAPELVIRGVGSTDREAGSDRSVVVFVDEIYIGRAGASGFDLYDLERVEVLRGPQGSIFGRNVVGGSVNLITANPTPEAEGYFNTTAGNLNLREGQGAVSGPLSDNLSARLAMSYKARNGYYRNRVFNKRSDDSKTLSGRVKLLYESDNAFTGVLTLESSEDTVDGVASGISGGELGDEALHNYLLARYADGDLPSSNPFVTDNNEFGYLDRSIKAYTARGDWDTDTASYTLLAGYRGATFDIQRDLVGIPIVEPGEPTTFVSIGPESLGFSPGLGYESVSITSEDYSASSLEFRIASVDDGGPFTWLAGLYYLDEETDRDQIRERNLALRSPLTTGGPRSSISRPLFDQLNQVTSSAIFGQVKYRWGERYTLTVGARHTKDEKDFSLAVSDTLQGFEDEIKAVIEMEATEDMPAATTNIHLGIVQETYDTQKSSETFSKFTPEVILDMQATDNILLYAKVSTGFKSGGFIGLGATREEARKPFDPEEVFNTEIGFKGTLADNRVQLNADIFSMSFDELQLRYRFVPLDSDGEPNPAGAFVTIVNAAEAEVMGFEADLLAYLGENFRITGSLALLDTEVTKATVAVRTGTMLPKAPEFSTSWNFTYTVPMAGDSSLDLSTGFQHTDDFYFDVNEVESGHETAYTLWDARVSYKSGDDDWNLSLWGKNLTDERYRTQVQSAAAWALITRSGEPRTFGLTFGMNF